MHKVNTLLSVCVTKFEVESVDSQVDKFNSVCMTCITVGWLKYHITQALPYTYQDLFGFPESSGNAMYGRCGSSLL